MTEYGHVEKPILEWLAGKRRDPNDRGLGWTYRTEEQMEAFGRPISDPLVEALLVSAIMRINVAVIDELQARLVVNILREIIRTPDPLEANRKTLDALRDGIPVVLQPGQPATTIKLIEFDLDKQDLNDFTVTNQYRVRGTDTCIADTVLLVNGIPVVVAEYKSFISSGHDWTEGVKQVHRYQREAPALLVPNVFCVAADEQEFRYGPVAFKIDSQRDIDAQKDHWKPWLSQYPARRLYWTLPESQRDEDSVRAAVHGLLRPCNVLDFIAHFVVFETKRGTTAKKIARYQQFEAANDMADRAVELYGRDVTAQERTGLIWHTQGSGKTLTMVYAASKLRRHPKLENPTVMIVVDRRDLKTQLSDDFENCDYPNVVKALGVEDLKSKIAGDRRETIITTLQCFQRMDDLAPSQRDNIISLVDEAHRSQKGKGAGFAMTMRAKLPKAFRFGFTGTPIDRTRVNTHRDFGPVKDGEQERYLSHYGIRQAIQDGATLPVYYEFRKIPLTVDEQPLSVGFEQMCSDMEVEDEEEKTLLQRRETRWKALTRDSRRVAKVIDHMVDHFLAHPDPSGFKAQMVANGATTICNSNGSFWFWGTYNTNLPAGVLVNNLSVHGESGILRAFTFGRSAWEVQAYTPPNADQKVNPTPPVTNALSPRISSGNSGLKYSVAWVDDRSGANNWHAYYRGYQYDATNKPAPIAADFRVDDSTPHRAQSVSVSHNRLINLPYTVAKVAWHDNRSYCNDPPSCTSLTNNIFYQHVQSDGYRLFINDQRADQAPASINATNASITYLENTDVAVAWQADRVVGTAQPQDVYARFLAGIGTPKGDQCKLNCDSASIIGCSTSFSASRPATASDPNSDVFVAWEETNGAEARILMSKYAADGRCKIGYGYTCNVVGTPVPCQSLNPQPPISKHVDSGGSGISRSQVAIATDNTKKCVNGTSVGQVCSSNADCPANWQCASKSNVFVTWWEKGSGSEQVMAKRCDNDLTTCTPLDAQCQKCVGGANNGFACLTGADCPSPGTCQSTGSVACPPAFPSGVQRGTVSTVATDPAGNSVIAWQANVNDPSPTPAWSGFARGFNPTPGPTSKDFRFDLAGRSAVAEPQAARGPFTNSYALAWRDERANRYDVYTRLVPVP